MQAKTYDDVLTGDEHNQIAEMANGDGAVVIPARWLRGLLAELDRAEDRARKIERDEKDPF